MPETDQEIFDHFRQVAGDERFEIGLMAYARYALEKYDWVTHKQIHEGHVPTDEETTRWITELTNSRLDGIYNGAISQFRAAAEDFMRSRLDEAQARALETAIYARVDTAAQRVERATSFRSSLFPNLFIGIVASFVFAVIVLVCSAIYHGDPSPFAMFKEWQTKPVPTPPASR